MGKKTYMQLVEEFERLRQDMIITGEKLGLDHPMVIAISQKIDAIHIEIIKEKGQKKFLACKEEKWWITSKEGVKELEVSYIA